MPSEGVMRKTVILINRRGLTFDEYFLGIVETFNWVHLMFSPGSVVVTVRRSILILKPSSRHCTNVGADLSTGQCQWACQRVTTEKMVI